MTTPYPLVRFPDAEYVAYSYLQEVLGESVTVCTDLPPGKYFDDALEGGIVRCVRIGGTRRIARVLDEANIDIDVYGLSFESVNDLVASVRAAIDSMQTLHTEFASVASTFEVSGPNRRPKEDEASYVRVGFTVGLLLRPASN